jgi:hypothetical protein
LARLLAAVSVEQHRRWIDTMRLLAGIEAPEPTNLSLEAALSDARDRRRVRRIVGRANRLLLTYPAGREGERGAPFDDRLMPTMLGNILRNGEDAAGDRYGLDMPTVYERMYPAIVAGRLGPVISQNLDVIDTAGALCVMTAVATAASLPLVGRLDWWSLVPVVMSMLSVASYKGALRAARRHAKHLATAFDLHRFDLVTALHWQPARDAESEYILNRQLTAFLAGRAPLKENLALRRRVYSHVTKHNSSA